MVSQTTLFVGNLPPTTTAKALADVFSRFGTLLKCEIPAPKNPDPSFVYGFVEFAEGADAVVAQKDMSVEKFDGALLRVKFATSTKAPGNEDMVDRRRLNNGSRRRSRSPGGDRTRHRSRDRYHDRYDRDDRRYRDRSREKSRYHDDKNESRHRDRQRSRERSPDQYRDRNRGRREDRDSMRSGDRFQDRPSERSGGRYKDRSSDRPSNRDRQRSPPPSDRFSGSLGYSRRSSREQSPAARDREMPRSSMRRDRSRTPPPRSSFDSSRRIPSPASPHRKRDDMELNHKEPASSFTAPENHGASDQKKSSATLWGQNEGW